MLLLKKIVAFVLLLGVFASCNQPKEKATAENKEDPKSNTYDAVNDQISLDTFYSWQNRWDDHYRDYIDTSSLNYFQMPVIDLTSIVGEGSDNARMFLGLAVIGNAKYEPHLMVMGVQNGRVDSTLIVDYTSACPPHCYD